MTIGPKKKISKTQSHKRHSTWKTINLKRLSKKYQTAKCPNCGAVLSSFVLNCPTCGHEIRGVATSKAIREFTMRLDKAESPSEKVSIIRNYTVPNTKEDIYEFMILASSNIGAGIEIELANAWESKLDQVIKKSKLIMHGQDEYRQLKEIYCQVIEKLNKKKKRENIKKLEGNYQNWFQFYPML